MATRQKDVSVLYAMIGRALSDIDYRERLMGEDEAERKKAFGEVLGVGVVPTTDQMKALDLAVEHIREFEAQFNGIRPCS